MKGSPALRRKQGWRGPMLKQHPAHPDPVDGDAGAVKWCQSSPWAQKVEAHFAPSGFLQEVIELNCIAKGD